MVIFANNNISSSTITIGGVSAKFVASPTGNTFGWIYANVPSGTTATVSVSGSGGFWIDGVFRTVGDSSAGVVEAKFNEANDTPFSPLSTAAFSVGAGESLVALALGDATTLGYSAGVTGGTQFTDGANNYLTGAQDYASAASQVVTAAFSGGSPTSTLVLAGRIGIIAPPPPTQWSFVGVSSAVTVTSGNITLTEPAGVQQDDILIAAIDARGNAAFTLPSGWTIVDTAQNSGNTTAAATTSIASGLMAYCIRGASAPGLTWNRTGGDLGFGRIAAWRAKTSGTPTYGSGTENTIGTASTSVTTSGVTTTAANELLVAAMFGARNVTSSNCRAATSPTTGSGATDTSSDSQLDAWTERADSGTTSGADGALAIFDATKTTAGSTGTVTITASASARHAAALARFQLPVAGSGITLAADAGSYALTGTAAGVKHGRVVGAGAGSYALTGQAATIHKGYTLVAAAGSYSLSGSTAALVKAWKLPAGAGSYALNGSAATLRHGWVVSAGAGSYALTGTDASLAIVSNKTIAAGAGSYSLTGNAASVLHSWKLAAASGSYALNGSAAGVVHGYRVQAGAGSYNLTGQAASLVHARKLVAGAGSYALSGSSAGLLHGRRIAATAGSYVLAGSDANLVIGGNLSLSADAGSYVLSGSAAGLLHGHVLSAGAGSYQINGSSAGLIHGYSLVAESGSYELAGMDATLWAPSHIVWQAKSIQAEGWTGKTVQQEVWTPVDNEQVTGT
jgi:hypothetical protein